MRLSPVQKLIAAFFLGCIITYVVLRTTAKVPAPSKEGYQDGGVAMPSCGGCGGKWPCSHCGGGAQPTCPPMPDMSKYVLKSSIPPPINCPDMSQYMLKTECPPAPDMSKYVLKSSIPPPQPIIIDSSKVGKECGECPPCPRPRCPDVKCPPPTVCPAPPPCPRPVCPETKVKCKAEPVDSSPVRPFLAPLDFAGFGQ